MDRFTEFLISWAPMLILIAVWIVYMRKWQTPQDQTVACLKKQVDLLEQQNQIFERMAAAMEKIERKQSA